MGNAPLVKVTYHHGTGKIHKYFETVYGYQEIYDKILKYGPFSCCSKPWVMRLYWIHYYDEILLESQEDFNIFMRHIPTSGVRHIHAKMIKPDECPVNQCL